MNAPDDAGRLNEMIDGADFDRLVELAGIEPEYWDIWGNYHPVGTDARRAILAALGLPAADEATIAASFERLEQHDWRRALPHVLVIREGQQPVIPLSLRSTRSTAPVRMQIIEESGWESTFVFHPDEASAQDARTIDGAEVLRYIVPLPSPLPLGYHVVRLADLPDEPLRLIVAPRQCYLPKALVSRAGMGDLGAALHDEAARQLGHRRLHRSARVGRDRRRTRALR